MTINYEEYMQSKKQVERPKVGYFNSLKDDGDETYVRFDYDSKQDFDVVPVHKVKIDDKWRNVECLKKDLKSPADSCPFCEAKYKLSVRIFVRLIEYVKDDAGNVTVQPNVWDRPTGFVDSITEAMRDAISDGDIAPDPSHLRCFRRFEGGFCQ